MKTPLILIFSAGLLWAGQSIVLTSGVVGNTSIPAQNPSNPCRVEESIHDWDQAASGRFAFADACGFNLTFFNGGGANIFLSLANDREANGGTCLIQVGQLATKFVTYRLQHVPNGPGGGVAYCEAWDINGNYLPIAGTFQPNTHSANFTGIVGSNNPGACVTGTGSSFCLGGLNALSTAYFRLYSTVVPVGSTPPTTSQSLAGCLVSWKFDGGNNTPTLADSCSAGPYPAFVLSGTAVYVATAGQNLVVALPVTANIPAQDQGWATWVSARVGFPNAVDCTRSYSQADASPAVSCQWTVTGGPMIPSLSDPSAAIPSYTPAAFGTYHFTLVAKDAANNTGTASLAVGAVSYDDNGVVIPSDPRVTEIFGPMIAFGQNPWGFADERAYTGIGLQMSYLQNTWELPNPSWMTNGQGTISYTFAGTGPGPGAPATTLSAPVSSSDTAIRVVDAGKLLGLTNLPTWITIGNTAQIFGGAPEMIRICGASATSGPATLTVCYNGRGMDVSGYNGVNYPAAQNWASGTAVGESLIVGSGTRFATDSNTPICPAGVPGPPGPITYSTGTVQLVGGNTTITGNGVSWNPTVAAPGNYIRVAAAHGGVPFVYWSLIASVTDGSHIVVDRAPPSDVDSTPFSYNLTGGVSSFLLSADFKITDLDGTTLERATQLPAGCESETAMFFVPLHDTAFEATRYTGVHYSYVDRLGSIGAFGYNFYGTGLAAYAFYLRSGYDPAYTLHQWVDNTWVKGPEAGAGYMGGLPLTLGGAADGAIVTAAIDPGTKINWTDVRQFARVGSIGKTPFVCYGDDTRDDSYYASWPALAAAFDPNPTYKAQWLQALGPGPGTIYALENTCKRSDNSWSNTGFKFAPTGPPLTVTNGSTSVTGTNIPSSTCQGIASGSVTVTNGSAVFTGSGLVDGQTININGTTNSGSAPFPVRLAFSQSGGKNGVLAALWPGDSGTFTYVIENNPAMTTFGTTNAEDSAGNLLDPMLKRNFACTWIDSGHIVLDRPWTGPSSGSGYNPQVSQGGLTGYGQQPYMMGIKVTELRWASLSDGLLGTDFAGLAHLAANWIQNVGFDPGTQGLNYGTGFGGCMPNNPTPTPGPNFASKQPWCSNGLGAIDAARALIGEANPGISQNYSFQRFSNAARAWGDTTYGSLWGFCQFTVAGFSCDPNYVAAETNNQSLGSYKWYGFFFGMGMSHQWPATRRTTRRFFAGSVQVQSGAPAVSLPSGAPWSTVGASTSPSRWETRLHTFTAAAGPATVFSLGPIALAISGSQLVLSISAGPPSADTVGPPTPAALACCTSRSDVLIRLQRDVANRQYTLELCDTTGGNCSSDVYPIAAAAQNSSWEGRQLAIGSGYQMAFLRWFSNAVPVGTPIQPVGVSGDLGNWEFESDLTDSGIHAINLSGGAVTFTSSPLYPPDCNAGAAQTLRAGFPTALNGAGSAPLDGGTTLAYLWQQLGHRQAALQWSSHAAENPEIKGLLTGPLSLQLTVTDGSSQSNTCSVNYTAVASADASFTGNPEVTAYVAFALSTVPGAQSVRVNTTAADGSTVATVCSSSPCAVPVDRTKGDQLVEVQYLSSSGAVISKTERPIVLGR